jgi:hypothetical protein
MTPSIRSKVPDHLLERVDLTDSADADPARLLNYAAVPRVGAKATYLRRQAMAKAGGSVSTGGATRLVYVIGFLKWIALAVIALGVLGATALSLAGGDGSLGPALSLLVLVYGTVAALAVYVAMGWLQQTLLMLIGIAKNTAKDDFLSRL